MKRVFKMSICRGAVNVSKTNVTSRSSLMLHAVGHKEKGNLTEQKDMLEESKETILDN